MIFLKTCNVFGKLQPTNKHCTVCTPTVSKAIEDGHFSDLYHMMNEGNFWGMQTMNQALVRYVKAGIITEEVAMKHAGIASELKQLLRR